MRPPIHTPAIAQHGRAATIGERRAGQHWQRGRQLAASGRWQDAAVAFGAASRCAPHDALYWFNLAHAHQHCQAYEAATAAARRVLAIEPDSAVARRLAGQCLAAQHRWAEAAACLDELPGGPPRDLDYLRELGLARHHANQFKGAIETYFQALALKIDDALTHYRLGLSFWRLNLKQEACECFRTVLALGLPGLEIGVQGLLSFFERESCRWELAQQHMSALQAAIAVLPDDAARWAAVFAHLTLSDRPLEQLKLARACARHIAGETGRLGSGATAPRTTDGRLRVGYVSADFHEHATSILMAEMLEQHDRAHFAVTLYSHGASDDTGMRRRIERSSETFVDVQGLSDGEIAQRIRDDGIDLLIDLKGHTYNGRLGIFAHRPAPLQVSFLGLPGTTGADFIDYVIGDPVVTPLAHAAHFSEKIAQMPVCYQPNDRRRPLPAPPGRAAVGLPEDGLVLCGFNQAYKISPQVMDTWCGFLRELPQAVLWLLDWAPQARAHIEAEAERRGIPRQRLVWAPRRSPADHLARLQHADLFIDTWPCNGHTTVSDALWAGVPVVSFAGDTFASRVATSLLHAVGLPELACADQAGYECKVLQLARDPQARARLRQRLVEARLSAPLFDSLRFTRDIEALYRRMWDRHAHAQTPDHLPADRTAVQAVENPTP
ncbi:MAG: tetratricopeptide repeat protein [Proteobacteria bacterium]|nr:tetratricopeptide repeat protein [Pseudomonadota bacterium]